MGLVQLLTFCLKLCGSKHVSEMDVSRFGLKTFEKKSSAQTWWRERERERERERKGFMQKHSTQWSGSYIGVSNQETKLRTLNWECWLKKHSPKTEHVECRNHPIFKNIFNKCTWNYFDRISTPPETTLWWMYYYLALFPIQELTDFRTLKNNLYNTSWSFLNWERCSQTLTLLAMHVDL